MPLVSTLQRICELQRSYSSSNTAEMNERGNLIRRTLVSDVRIQESELRTVLGRLGNDIGLEGSDGIGRKTEAPWVRIYSKQMSPSAREGYYVVIHFAANGSAVFVTLGCGSTVWANGDLTAVSDAELARRTGWARRVIQDRFGTLDPFDEQMNLGAKADLPRTFEKATAIAKRIPVEDLEENSIRRLISEATRRLALVYEAQSTGSDRPAGNILDLDIQGITKPSKTIARGQGYSLSGDERAAIEQRAMTLAKAWLETQGYEVVDRSRNQPFDYEASKADRTLKIEVKGTTAEVDDAILMTKNEVELHQTEQGKTGLIIVCGIKLERTGAGPTATGGIVKTELGWNISTWDLVATAFRVSRRR